MLDALLQDTGFLALGKKLLYPALREVSYLHLLYQPEKFSAIEIKLHHRKAIPFIVTVFYKIEQKVTIFKEK